MENEIEITSKKRDNEYKTYSMELCGRILSVDIGRVSAQASAGIFVHYGDTMVLSTVTASKEPREGVDFFPLSVEFEEKMYAVGKIPGGFNKREGKAGEHSVLTARAIDRPMRPLFPKDYRNDVLIDNVVLSVDPSSPPEIPAMLGSSLAVSISDIPFDGPCAATNVGLIGGEFIFNPSNDEKLISDLDLTVASVKDRVIMIEAGGNEIPDEVMIEAIYRAHEINQSIISWMEGIVSELGKTKQEYSPDVVPEEIIEAIEKEIPLSEMEEVVLTDDKLTRDRNIDSYKKKLEDKFADHEEYAKWVSDALDLYEKKTVRRMILKDHRRPDGRDINEIRPLSAEIDVVPRVHGSALFSRGQTQILNICTLGPLSDAQKIEGLNTLITSKRYMHNYNFPSYSVGETKPPRGPGRREIGHGALAEKALRPVLPSTEEFPYAIRTVSETLESNGSTSQASVCASSLSLMAAGVPIKAAVAGISCGLVTGESDDDYIVLTDIQGLEDFFGDMDFKVAGTRKGITAIQMDIKIHGLTRAIVEEAIAKTHKARLYILDNVMDPVISKPRAELSKYAPKIVAISIDPSKIGDVVGKQGKTINRIIEETGVQIDIDDDGQVSVCGVDQEMIDKAIETIRSIVIDIEPGMVMSGRVVNILSFGAQVELSPNKKGLVHISRLTEGRVGKVEDVVKVGDEVTVKVIAVDSQGGKIDLSMKPSDVNGEGVPESDARGRNRNGSRSGFRRERGFRERGRR